MDDDTLVLIILACLTTLNTIMLALRFRCKCCGMTCSLKPKNDPLSPASQEPTTPYQPISDPQSPATQYGAIQQQV